MKVYLAHNFAARDWLADVIIPMFQHRGHTITSRWITNDSHLRSEQDGNSAQEDLEDIVAADYLVLFTDQYAEKSGKGKFIELGYALGLGAIFVALVGEDLDSSVFYALPRVSKFKQLKDLLNTL